MIEQIENLVMLLKRLPGLGSKSALRIVFYLLQAEPSYVEELAEGIKELKLKVKRCEECGNFTTSSLCDICSDPNREREYLCIVANVTDLWAIEQSNIYKGLYHVLHGVLSPLDGITYEKLNLGNLKSRIKERKIKEVIVALPPTVEGEATTTFIKEMLKDQEVKVTRIASGIPHGAELEYADSITLSRAFEGRREI